MKDKDFKIGDIVTIDGDPPADRSLRSPDYQDRLNKIGKIVGVDTKIAGENSPVCSVRWQDIPNDVRPYPWWQLAHAPAPTSKADRP